MTFKRTSFLLTLTMTALSLNACGGADHFTPTAANNTYFCDNARQMIISIGDQSNDALVQVEGRIIDLKRIDTNKGLAFTNNIYTLFYDPDENLAVLEREGVPTLTGCRG